MDEAIMPWALLKWIKKPRTAAVNRRERLMGAFRAKYANFKILLESNTELLKIISDIETKLRGQMAFGGGYIEAVSMRAIFHAGRMVKCFEAMSDRPQSSLSLSLERIQEAIKQDQGEPRVPRIEELVLDYDAIIREMAASVGPKNANICEVRNRLGLDTPHGFAITTTAFDRFIAHNRLAEFIGRHKQKLDIYETETIVQVSDDIREQLMAAEIPPDLKSEIHAAYNRLCKTLGRSSVHLSIRSSAIGEDASLSFAGQYQTLLNVPAEQILEAYKEIVASLFSARAIAYRLHMGFPFQAAAMGVACQEMIAARASGVMYTRDPVDALQNRIIIKAVWGLGPYAVDGVVPPDSYTFSKGQGTPLKDWQVTAKDVQLVSNLKGNVGEIPVDPDQRALACLSQDQARCLAEWGLRLEEHFGVAQDVEWALTEEGRLVILQARPLRVEGERSNGAKRRGAPLAGYAVLAEGGEVACPGAGAGPVFIVRTESDLLAFPDGAILVSAHSSPQLVMVMDRAQAILADVGNLAGHMASLAREYMVPTILNLKDITRRLAPGLMVTVDAYNGRIYEGRVESLLEAETVERGSSLRGTPEYQALRRRADQIVPLNLVDPKSSRFMAENCRTIHDIMRFIHEKSYGEIFQLGDLVTERGQLSVRLNAPIPIDLFLIDLGGGLNVDGTAVAAVRADQVTSAPFGALLKGMLHDGLCGRDPRPVNLGGFLSVMSRQMLESPRLEGGRFGDRSYAIISDVYMNFSSRVGYHYSILDSYCGRTTAKNYINFQFKGGAADDTRRNRRARVIERVLAALDFLVDTTGDRVAARLAKQETSVMLEKLDQLGRLLIYTRQMDMLMNNEDLVERMAVCFMAGNYALDPIGDKVECRPNPRPNPSRPA
jgi:pyruvate,water dikinase